MPVRFTCFPRTKPPPRFVELLVGVFASADEVIGAASAEKGFGSDRVLAEIAPSLRRIGFQVESGKKIAGRIDRPVFFGEGGTPSLRYQVDAYQAEWQCGLEVEAGRGLMGNAFYRDLVQAMVMVEVEHLCVALLNRYEFSAGHSNDYHKAIDVADALYSHDRVGLPFGLTVIGYGPIGK